MTSPTHRSKADLEENGWRVEIVEKWIPVPALPAGGVRKDLFGFGDLIAKKRGERTLIVQVTSLSNVPARRTKILTECREDAMLCLETGDRIVIHGWGKRKRPIGRKLWHCRTVEITLLDFDIAAKVADAQSRADARQAAESEAHEFVAGGR